MLNELLLDYKRLIVGQLPRRIIDSYFVSQLYRECGYSILKVLLRKTDISETSECFKDGLAMSTGVKAFTLIIFIATSLQFLLALFLYIPLLMRIRGNLKEYCAHKIDKRYI
jgi:hypothetical protein